MKVNLFKKFGLLIPAIILATNADAQVYTFTTAGATGISGPSQAQVNTAYATSNLAGTVTATNGIQYWSVPVAGLYKIEVRGAKGYGANAGRGAFMSGEFTLNAADQLKILVGQQGGCCVASGTQQFGGGGGTFVTTSTNTPLIVAGGGGGANGNGSIQSNSDASITTNGNAGQGTSSGAGGTAGSGGAGVAFAGGGGGFSGNGGDVAGTPGGFSFLNGGVGGSAGTTSGGWGGFGGGGGANSWDNRRGGGGGGYSGGGGAGSSTGSSEVGGGGGSFNSGINQINTPALGTGDGQVVITLLTPASMVPNNTGVTALPSINGAAFCSGSQPVTARIRNFGNNFIDSVKVGWEVNGVFQAEAWHQVDIDTFPVTPYDVVVTLGNYNFGSGTHTVRAWTSLPNNQVDTVNINDTTSVTVTTMLSGTYTVNAAQPTAGTNYQSFSALTSDLNSVGICAPVTVNVVAGSGPYNEQVSFGNVPGTSATNTIKVNGNGNIVQFNTASGSTLPLLQLQGTKHLKIDNLNFKTLSTSAAWAAWITGGAEHDSLINCSFDLSTVTSTASGSNSGIVLTGSNTSATGAGASGRHIAVVNNHLIGSAAAGGLYYAVSLNAEADSNYIGNNIIENYYYYGVYMAANVGNHIIGNEITRPNKTAGFTTTYAIYLASGTASQGHRIERNRIHSNTAPNATSTSIFYGIGTLADPPATNPVIIANNVIYNIKGGTLYGLYASTATNTKFYHNTVSFDQPTGSTNANYGIYATGTNTGTEFINNNISITAGGIGVKYGFYYVSAASVADVQKNNIYLNSSLPGAQNYGYYTTAYATQAAFQTAYPALEIGSPTADPAFISIATGDLNPSNPAILTAGNNLLADVPTDINGVARSTTPTLGAFELAITGTNNARSFSIISPSGNFCDGNNPTRVVIGNVGTNDITSLQVHWSVNGVAQPVFNYTDTLVPIGSSSGQSLDTVLLGNANLNAGTNTIVAYTVLPNGVADPHPNDDTVSITATPATFAVSVSHPVICANEQSILSLTPNSGYADGDIEWEYSTNGTTWTSIPNSDTVNYVVTNIGTTTHYRARILSSGQDCVSPMGTVDVNYIPPPTFVEDESCVPGVTLNISATPASGTTLKWYEDLTTTTVFSTANNITTIPLFATKTYYAASVSTTGCESVRTPVNATIHVLPPVNLGFDLDTCISGSGTVVLDPGPQHPGATYLWDNNSTASTRSVSQSGVYSVTVTDTNTCSFADTIMVNINPRPEIDLAANGTGFCNGAVLTLDAGPDGENGGSYYWNNGATTRTLDITASGTYTVSVTSPAGCLGTDTVEITVDGFAPTTNGIHVTPLSPDSFNFTAINPQNVDNYEWDFGDGSPVSISSNPTHKFAGNGEFLVQMRSISSCADKIDSAYVNIVGLSVDGLNKALNAIQIYPNPNSNGQLNINSGKDIALKSIVFVNITGQTVHTESDLSKGLEVHQVNIPAHLANGMYMLKIDTDKGMITKKVELNR